MWVDHSESWLEVVWDDDYSEGSMNTYVTFGVIEAIVGRVVAHLLTIDTERGHHSPQTTEPILELQLIAISTSKQYP